MGKTLADVKMWNFLDEDKIKSGELLPVFMSAQIAHGATGVVLPQKVALESLKESYENERQS